MTEETMPSQPPFLHKGFDVTRLRTRQAKLEAERAAEAARLRAQVLAVVPPIVARHGAAAAYLFGSIPAGSAHARSDVDLVVLGIGPAAYWELRRELEEALRRPLDLHTQDDDPTFVAKAIARGECIELGGASDRQEQGEPCCETRSLSQEKQGPRAAEGSFGNRPSALGPRPFARVPWRNLTHLHAFDAVKESAANPPGLLLADIRDELAKLKRLESAFAAVEPMLSQPPEAVSDYDRGAVGYLLHNFYNGCENIFRAIAAYFENDIGTDTWHADLLRRMRLEIPSHRPAVIDDELYRLLNDFRGFRHVFRSAYSFELDWERERLVGGRLPRAAALLHRQVNAFLAWVEGLEPGA